MSINVGTDSIGEICLGSDPIYKVYEGTNLVWNSPNYSFSNAPEYIYRTLNSSGVLSAPSGTLKDASSITALRTNALYNAFCMCTNLTGTVNFPNLALVAGKYSLRNCFYGCTNLTSVNFPSLVCVEGNGNFDQTFRGCTGLTNVNFSSLTTLKKSSNFSQTFYGCTGLTIVNFPLLAHIEANSFDYGFFQCSNLTTVNFPSLNDISYTGALRYAFYYCTSISDVYFNSLKTSSFGSYVNQFEGLLHNTGTSVNHTLHFPSNLQSTISTLSGYPNFGGTSGYVTLAFDLSPTS